MAEKQCILDPQIRSRYDIQKTALMDRNTVAVTFLLFLTSIFSIQAALMGDGVEGDESSLRVEYIDEVAAIGSSIELELLFQGLGPTLHIGPISEMVVPSANELLDLGDPTPNFVVPSGISAMELEFPKPVRRKSPYLAVTLSTLCPGLGHTYLGDMKTAAGLMGTTGLSMASCVAFDSDPVIVSSSLATATNTWMYGIYAAYRDVRIHNGQLGYLHQMPTDSLADLAYAPFNIHVMKKPEVWGGLLGSFALVVGISHMAFSKKIHSSASHSVHRAFAPIMALPIGIGEESFFRGFLQSALSESLTPWGGIVLSSLLFGAAHIGNANMLAPQNRAGYYKFILPFITLSGVYDGWLTYKNHSLKSNVAIHTWYDFVLFAMGIVGSQSVVGRTQFALSLPF